MMIYLLSFIQLIIFHYDYIALALKIFCCLFQSDFYFTEDPAVLNASELENATESSGQLIKTVT